MNTLSQCPRCSQPVLSHKRGSYAHRQVVEGDYCKTCRRIRKVSRSIDSTHGRFFSVTFTKRTDGTTRRMIARTGVRKGVTGEGMAYKPRERGLIVVWSADSQGYRMVPAENVISITFRGKEVRFQ